MISFLSESLACKNNNSLSREGTRIERAIEVILRAMSNCSKEWEDSITNMSSGRLKFEVVDSFTCILPLKSLSLALLFFIISTHMPRG